MRTTHRVYAHAVAGACMALALGVTGCVLAPGGTRLEEAAARQAGEVYARPPARPPLPELPEEPTWQQLLERAFLANGDLEAAYFEWVAALARIQQAGGYPNTPLSASFSYMFSSQNMKTFDRASATIGPDPMQNLAFPPKVYQAGKVALDDARAAGKRFAAAKFDLQRRVLNDWLDYALIAERLRIQRENVPLLRLIFDTAAARVRAGGARQDLLRAETAYRLADNELQNLEAQLPQMRARLNAMLARDPDAPLAPPADLPAPRPLPFEDDADLLARARARNPELAALAWDVEGRRDAVGRARLQYVPDFNPFVGATGAMSQVVGLAVSIPTFLPAVRGMVKEARADLRRAVARYRQTGLDRAAAAVAALHALRNGERQADLFERIVRPAAEGVLTSSRGAYAAGTGSFIDLVDSQRTLLDVRLLTAEARVGREKSLADLEALLGVDVENLAPLPPTADAPPPTPDDEGAAS